MPGIRSEIIGRQRLAFVAAPDHALARRKRVRARELRDYPFSGPLKGSMYGRLLHSVMAEIGITDFAMITQAQDPRVWRELLCCGIGISCLLHLSAVPDIEAGRLVEIPVIEDTPEIEVRIGFSPLRAISPASQAFVEFLRERGFVAGAL
jgi:DNA-binding transcriptional LysR family regulator